MQFSVKFAVLAFIAQVAVISASPVEQGNDSHLSARAPTKRPTQQECEAACTLLGLQGQQWQQCVDDCVRSNYPTPPPTPPQQSKPKVPSKRPSVKVARAPTKRPTQQECEAACTLLGLQGQAWQQCVDDCVRSNYPTPPPTPPQQSKPKVPSKRPGVKVARAPTKRPTQQECEAACTLMGLQGQAWQQCVDDCVRINYPSPPPTPQHVRPKVSSMRPGVKVARAPTKRPTQQECEAACTLLGLQGAAWQTCVDDCVASNYPTPPPTPPQQKPKKPQAPVKKPIRARDAQDDE